MKWEVFAILLVAGLVSAGQSKKREVLRRSTRSAISNMIETLIRNMETTIISSCQANGLSSSGSTELQDSFNDLVACMNKVKIYTVPHQEYYDYFLKCSRDTIKKTKECLSDDRQYFPDFILDSTKSLVDFFYNNEGYQTNTEIVACLNKITQIDVLLSYIECLQTSVGPNTEVFPTSKAGLCQQYLPAIACFPQTFKKFCLDTKTVHQFFDNYLGALSSPCEF